MSKAVLLELADRVEKASGPDLELDAEIWMTLHPDWRDYPRNDFGGWDCQTGKTRAAQPFTSSLDAAMTLVPEGWSVKLYIHPGENSADLYLLGDYSDGNRPLVLGPIEAEACATSALALTAASLRACAQQESKYA